MKGWSLIEVAAGIAEAYVFLARDRFNGPRQPPDGLIQATGRIEGDRVRVVVRVEGRIGAMLVREGSTAAAGETMLRLDDPATMARLDHARAAWVSAAARVNESRGRLASARSAGSIVDEASGVRCEVARPSAVVPAFPADARAVGRGAGAA